MWGRKLDKMIILSSAVYISFSFTWIELKWYAYLIYFMLFILKMVNTRSDEIQTLIESK